jgi:hypothetical protein
MVSSSRNLMMAALCLSSAQGFTVQNGSSTSRQSSSALQISSNNEEGVSRRTLFQSAAALSVASIASTFNPELAVAAGSPPSAAELARIKTGYDGLTYLLENFEAETTVCRENGGECKRDAERVRKYLGLRSTTDPLFQIEKVFVKVKYMDVDPDEIESFFEATEEWNTAQNMSNSMAFISQFAEYNPGGGKDEVLKYLDEAQKQVITARGALEKILKAIESAS